MWRYFTTFFSNNRKMEINTFREYKILLLNINMQNKLSNTFKKIFDNLFFILQPLEKNKKSYYNNSLIKIKGDFPC